MLVICPAVGFIWDAVEAVVLPAGGGVNTATIRFGVLKFAWFKALKISARNCKRSLSLIGISFVKERSHVVKPGPIKVSLPALP